MLSSSSSSEPKIVYIIPFFSDQIENIYGNSIKFDMNWISGDGQVR